MTPEEQEKAMVKYYEHMNKRKCDNCRFCKYIKTFDPDSHTEPLDYQFKVNDVLRMCRYCLHVFCNDNNPGERIGIGGMNTYYCYQCGICRDLRTATPIDILEDLFVPAEFVRVCDICLHVGCSRVDDGYWMLSSAERAKLDARTDSTDRDIKKLSSLSSGSHSKKTRGKKSDDTQSDIEKMTDPSLDPPPQFEMPTSSSKDSSSSKRKKVWSRAEQSRSKLPAGEAASGSQATRITEPNITTDEAASGSQAPRITEPNITTDEAASGSQAARITEPNKTTDEAASGGQEFQTDTPQPRINFVSYKAENHGEDDSSNDAEGSINVVNYAESRPWNPNRVILGVIFGLIVIAALKFGPSRVPNS